MSNWVKVKSSYDLRMLYEALLAVIGNRCVRLFPVGNVPDNWKRVAEFDYIYVCISSRRYKSASLSSLDWLTNLAAREEQKVAA